jgi:ribonuclease HI
VSGCKRKHTKKCECGIDWTENIYETCSIYVGEHVTNNECEWAAMYKAVKRAVATGELHLDLYTDSDIVTNQLLNNISICEPIHATYHALTVAELAKVKVWHIQHVHHK